MVKMQIEISVEENQIVEIYKALKGFSSKKQAIKSLIRDHKELIEKLQ